MIFKIPYFYNLYCYTPHLVRIPRPVFYEGICNNLNLDVENEYEGFNIYILRTLRRGFSEYEYQAFINTVLYELRNHLKTNYQIDINITNIYDKYSLVYGKPLFSKIGIARISNINYKKLCFYFEIAHGYNYDYYE